MIAEVEARIFCETCRQTVGVVHRVPVNGRDGVYEHDLKWSGGLSGCIDENGRRTCDQPTRRDQS